MKTTIIWSVLFVVVLALGAWWFLGSKPATVPSNGTEGQQTATSTTATTTTSSTSGTKSTSSGSTVAGGNFTCSITSSSDAGDMTGNIYTADKKTRIDFTFRPRASDTEVTTHVIRSGSWSYSWVQGQSTGTKTAYTPSSKTEPQPTGGIMLVDGTTATASECHPWAPKADLLTPPTLVKFTTK